MSLIKCPECEGLLSTGANACPHCGYVLTDDFLDGVKSNICIIQGVAYDFTEVVAKIRNDDILLADTCIEGLTGFNMKTRYKIVKAIQDNNNEVPARLDIEVKMSTAPKCPTCGSTNLTKISAATRAFDGMFFGKRSVEGRAQFRCNKCGYLW